MCLSFLEVSPYPPISVTCPSHFLLRLISLTGCGRHSKSYSSSPQSFLQSRVTSCQGKTSSLPPCARKPSADRLHLMLDNKLRTHITGQITILYILLLTFLKDKRVAEGFRPNCRANYLNSYCVQIWFFATFHKYFDFKKNRPVTVSCGDQHLILLRLFVHGSYFRKQLNQD
jgi:hypothetical protein